MSLSLIQPNRVRSSSTTWMKSLFSTKSVTMITLPFIILRLVSVYMYMAHTMNVIETCVTEMRKCKAGCRVQHRYSNHNHRTRVVRTLLRADTTHHFYGVKIKIENARKYVVRHNRKTCFSFNDTVCAYDFLYFRLID